MPKRVFRLAAGTAVIVSLLSACGGGTGGTAGPSAASGSPSSSTGSSNAVSGVPKVPAPLPTDKLVADPCSALADEDAKTLGLATPGTITDVTPRGCDWKSEKTPGNGVTVSPIVQNKNGLADTYAAKPTQAYFEETQVAGYPAVFTDKSDGRKNGICVLVVGVTDQLSVAVVGSIVNGKNVGKPCEPSSKVATAMINHLKAAS
ncbi:uncharacterized protein DUF3558 [Amycolatopsis echigonensis]|uniref:Uncharacterized protein DUF3558 n=1 Tax=Amycolatopsis echigonensis TaxID=2576905 RepID=A0A2N3WGP4_9PSEU|nr:DUF3558 domain-containing protein [Amycolatopsis niigatensis]PKV93041.1 uncharacterized protein DUF3558 [Amycolatopsis niigatensis]